eukprot:TRINITY_DN14768_c0_g1_i1.p2 TRINITY_DN14768_c0_g1~~TRINITY_DN14768_c0_g1_i1.p2  ORF type:complete len:124 (+),score=48.88 TRINITY_DN14768_c0_g1_i1:153-524(+)
MATSDALERGDKLRDGVDTASNPEMRMFDDEESQDREQGRLDKHMREQEDPEVVKKRQEEKKAAEEQAAAAAKKLDARVADADRKKADEERQNAGTKEAQDAAKAEAERKKAAAAKLGSLLNF